MSIISSLKLDQWEEFQLPDSWSSNLQATEPDANFVISRATDGSVTSRYKDNVWIMKMYDASGVCVYNFNNWHSGRTTQLAELISTEIKQIQFARLYLYPDPRKPVSKVMTPLLKLARLAFKNNISIRELFLAPNTELILAPSYTSLKRNPMHEVLSLLKELYELTLMHPSYTLSIRDHKVIEQMQILFDRFPKPQCDSPQQTKLIPSRIYSALIVALNKELEAFNNHSDAIYELFKQKKTNHLFGLGTKASQYKASISWEVAVQEADLEFFFNEKSITDWHRLFHYINEIQSAAQYWVHLFSGMRANEVRHLPADTYTTINANGSNISILRGYTSKFSGQNYTKTFWVTASIVEIGIAAARKIGEICAIRHDYQYSNLSQYPLFPALIQTQSKTGHQVFEGAPVVCRSIKSRIDRLLNRWPDLLVQECDIQELERFDGFKDWRNDSDIKAGQIWPLTTHQCRRSLAVYSARSGLVSLGSLALQFKQLTEAMASYYRRGSIFAENFLISDESARWLDELEQERRIAQYLDYESNVLNSTSRLWGGEGKRIQVARDKGQPLIITTDREMTLRKFKKGEMAYKDGPIGGCTNLNSCDKISFTNIFACIYCEKSILDDSRSLKRISRTLHKIKQEQKLYDAQSPLRRQLELEIKEIYRELEKHNLLETMENLQ